MKFNLQVRKRRDGTLALISAGNRDVAAPDRKFPELFVFTPGWIIDHLGDGIIEVAGDKIVVKLVNARGTYRIERDRARIAEILAAHLGETPDEAQITGRVQRGDLHATLVETELLDAPPIDETKALEVAQGVWHERIATLAKEADIDTETARRVLVARNEITPEPPTESPARDGEV